MRTARPGGLQIADEEQSRHMLKIGEVSKRSGIGIEALRFYERGGLLDSPARTFSGYRVYGEEVLERLEFIKRADANLYAEPINTYDVQAALRREHFLAQHPYPFLVHALGALQNLDPAKVDELTTDRLLLERPRQTLGDSMLVAELAPPDARVMLALTWLRTIEAIRSSSAQ